MSGTRHAYTFTHMHTHAFTFVNTLIEQTY
nr:MAG TPA: hypothetical protein [Caudoviricetes sp.]